MLLNSCLVIRGVTKLRQLKRRRAVFSCRLMQRTVSSYRLRRQPITAAKLCLPLSLPESKATEISFVEHYDTNSKVRRRNKKITGNTTFIIAWVSSYLYICELLAHIRSPVKKSLRAKNPQDIQLKHQEHEHRNLSHEGMYLNSRNNSSFCDTCEARQYSIISLRSI